MYVGVVLPTFGIKVVTGDCVVVTFVVVVIRPCVVSIEALVVKRL